MSTTIQEGKFLSDLLGAHDISDFVLEVVGLSATSPQLERGDVVCRMADGTMTLAGSQGTLPADVCGIVLDYAVVPGSAVNPVEPPNFSVARSGVFDATMFASGRINYAGGIRGQPQIERHFSGKAQLGSVNANHQKTEKGNRQRCFAGAVSRTLSGVDRTRAS